MCDRRFPSQQKFSRAVVYSVRCGADVYPSGSLTTARRINCSRTSGSALCDDHFQPLPECLVCPVVRHYNCDKRLGDVCAGAPERSLAICLLFCYSAATLRMSASVLHFGVRSAKSCCRREELRRNNPDISPPSLQFMTSLSTTLLAASIHGMFDDLLAPATARIAPAYAALHATFTPRFHFACAWATI